MTLFHLHRSSASSRNGGAIVPLSGYLAAKGCPEFRAAAGEGAACLRPPHIRASQGVIFKSAKFRVH